jgi:hypothetical protein
VAIAVYLAFSGRPPSPEVTRDACGPIAGAAGPVIGLPCTRVGTLVGENPGYAAPGGPLDGTLLGSGRWGIDSNQDSRLSISILGDSVIASGVPWVRAYMPAYPSGGGDNDLFTWLPLAVEGKLRIVDIRTPECPSTRDNLSTLGVLDPFTLARCLGAGSFTVTGRTGLQRRPVAYDVEPAWIGGWSGEHQGFSLRDEPVGEPVDAQLRDGEIPPRDFVIELTAHVGDSAARECRRTKVFETYPVESRDDSILWCMTRVVTDRWNALLGPEDRPIDPGHPQLHRHERLGACGGVNAGVQRFRLDAGALDPVWLEGIRGGRSVPSFTDDFQPAFQPEFVIVDRSGRVVIKDGLEIDTNGNFNGHFICPTGLAVYFN